MDIQLFNTFNFVRKGDIESVKNLLDTGTDPNLRNMCGASLLSLAIDYYHFEIAKLLLEYGADPNLPTQDNVTPLMRASNTCHFETIKLLIDCGACPDVKSDAGFTVFDFKGGEFVVSIILEKEHKIILK